MVINCKTKATKNINHAYSIKLATNIINEMNIDSADVHSNKDTDNVTHNLFAHKLENTTRIIDATGRMYM